MANSLVVVLMRHVAPMCKPSVTSLNYGSSSLVRYLYTKSSLGIDTFIQHKRQVMSQMTTISEKFRDKMTEYSNEDSKNMIFTEDLKNMVHLAESDDDISLVVKMMKKFNQQNKELRFGNFVFGPVVMRLLHYLNKPDVALECFQSSALSGFFDQLISYQLLMDLLYENQMYEEMLEVFAFIKDRQIEGPKYPKNMVVLTMAACYKLNSKQSLEFALNLWKDLGAVGHNPMRRATTFCGGLALNQGQPEVALEIISTAKNPNYTTLRNIRAAALAEANRLEDVIVVLKSVLTEDIATNIAHTFNRDVIERIKAIISKADDNPDISLEFDRLLKLFERQGHIAEVTLDEQLCSEIQAPTIQKNRQQNIFSRYEPSERQQGGRVTNFRQRPGLRDLV